MTSKRPTSVVIDPVAMNIVNKIAQGSTFAGDNTVHGGIMVEGTIGGNTTVHGGPLVLMAGATLYGNVEVHGDAYIFGQVGTKSDNSASLTVHGELHLTSKCAVHGRITYGKLALYKGAVVSGSIEPFADSAPAPG